MTTVLTETPPQTHVTAVTATQRLRTRTTAVRLSFTWLGVRKSLTAEQKSQAAESFGAEQEFLSAGKKLLDTKHPAFKAVTGVRSRALALWRGMTLPYPEPGVRLIQQDRVEQFHEQMSEIRSDLDDAVRDLDEHYADLRSAARDRLGRLYNPADYPASLQGLFAVAWDFPSVEPPHYLQQLSPDLYEQECQRVQARFQEAVHLAEQAFIDELQQLVAHLTERLSGQVDGKPKVFRDSAVGNLQEFFQRFQQLNVRSSEQLDELVLQCQQVVQGLQPQQLRDSRPLRQHVATELGHVQSLLDELLVDRPRRNILRRARSEGA